MKRLEPESIGDVLRRAIEQQGMSERLYETRAASLWPSAVGADIASQTSKASVWQGVMTVYVRNASLRHDLHMGRSSLIKLINEALGREIIKEIRFK